MATVTILVASGVGGLSDTDWERSASRLSVRTPGEAKSRVADFLTDQRRRLGMPPLGALGGGDGGDDGEGDSSRSSISTIHSPHSSSASSSKAASSSSSTSSSTSSTSPASSAASSPLKNRKLMYDDGSGERARRRKTGPRSWHEGEHASRHTHNPDDDDAEQQQQQQQQQQPGRISHTVVALHKDGEVFLGKVVRYDEVRGEETESVMTYEDVRRDFPEALIDFFEQRIRFAD